MSNIFIYGVSGSGKTTISRLLKLRLNLPLIQADYLRNIAQLEHSIEDQPFIYAGTTEAYKLLGTLTSENSVTGLRQVRTAMQPYVLNEVELYENTNFIMEAAFLDPEVMEKFGEVFLIRSTPDKQYERFFTNRTHTANVEESFKCAQLLQEFLEAETFGVTTTIIDNVGSPELAVNAIMRVLKD